MSASPVLKSAASPAEPLLQVRNLTKHFPIRKGILNRVVGAVKAVDGISFDVYPNETIGLVGESGCGKTTAGRSILRLLEPTSGEIIYGGKDIVGLPTPEMRVLRRNLQIIFQDPFSSLNPRMTIEDIIGEAIEFHGVAKGDAVRTMVEDLLVRVGLQPAYITRYPHEFSGGQRQRIGIARALALNPDFIVCDEAVSALDVSVQAQVINLLLDLQEEFNLSYLFIAHDLSVVRHISDRIAVMYLGRIMELADCDTLFENALHPYTQALLSAIPQPNPRRNVKRVILQGDVPSPMNPPHGCRFHTRCPARFAPCDTEEPRIVDVGPGHQVACHLYDPAFAPTDPTVWRRLPRLPLMDGDVDLPTDVAAVIRELAPEGQLAREAAEKEEFQGNESLEEEILEEAASEEEAKSDEELETSSEAEATDEEEAVEESDEGDNEEEKTADEEAAVVDDDKKVEVKTPGE